MLSAMTLVAQDSWQTQIEAAIQRGDAKEAIMIIDRVIETTPKQPTYVENRGMIKFRLGMIEESIQDFDAVVAMNKDLKPYLWQRGIALYYAGRYAEGQEQFEVHQTVNKNDVENAAWHFLCVAKQEGVDAARKKLITSVRDSRPPLMEALEMYKGKLEPEAVIAAADKARGGPEGQRLARFYGYLYVGLYYDAIGKPDLAVEWLKKSLEQNTGGYMADVARIDLLLREKKKALSP